MSLCDSIDTLAMAYLDDELAGEERRELELHLGECASCKAHLETERAEISFVRKALVAPPAPDMVKARIARALDAEDKIAARAGRKRWQRYLLPGSALAAAAAALALFVGMGVLQDAKKTEPVVAKEVMRQQTRSLPLEVEGQRTGPWLRANFAPVEPPQFHEGIQLIGARATAIAGHDAAQLRYLVNVGVNRVSLTAMLIADLQGDELQGGQPVKMGRLTLHVYDVEGLPAVTYVDENRIGYVFTSERMSLDELLSLVGTSDLISRAQQQR
ncbi:MAG: anti-sigma factor [Kofleriaceae bacterium]